MRRIAGARAEEVPKQVLKRHESAASTLERPLGQDWGVGVAARPMESFLDEQAMAHLHSGCALIVGCVADDGTPHAGRGWGLTVCSTEPLECRVLIAAADTATLRQLSPGRRIAVTSADVATLRSYQLKGEVLEIATTTADDAAKLASYCAQFFDDIEAADRHPRAPLEAWAPQEVVPVIARMDELYWQTPGPGAGGELPLSGERLR